MNKIEFDNILDKNETIIKVIKPNKKRFLWITVILEILGFIFIGGGLIVIGLCGGQATNDPSMVTGFCVAGAVFILIFLISILVTSVRYKKTFYAVTDKRVIIKTGFIGVDFSALDLNTIGAVNVNVDFLDKIITPKETGSIQFGSMSMPMGNVNQGNSTPTFQFFHVDNPYDLYKEIKEYINDAKEKLNKENDK